MYNALYPDWPSSAYLCLGVPVADSSVTQTVSGHAKKGSNPYSPEQPSPDMSIGRNREGCEPLYRDWKRSNLAR